MEMNSPIGPNVLDTQGIVGKPIDRVDGRSKVTGGARYAYEMQQENVLYGFVVEASIGKGTIRSIDTRAAEKAPCVALILTHRNADALSRVGADAFACATAIDLEIAKDAMTVEV
jgi:xanthine dehydrogenase YagR molybdenum-binding subunit